MCTVLYCLNLLASAVCTTIVLEAAPVPSLFVAVTLMV